MNRDTNKQPQPVERKEPMSWRTYQVRVEIVREIPAPYGEPLTFPPDVYELFREDVARWDRERFITVLLDASHRVLGVEEVSVGTLTSAPVHPREVMKAAILTNAAAIILIHNHPTGELRPSLEDIAITQRLRQVADLLQIRCLDHFIIGPTSYFSFVENDMWGQLPK